MYNSKKNCNGIGYNCRLANWWVLFCIGVYMENRLLSYFWNCGDNDIIEFAILRAHLNKHERDVIHFMLDECMTQEEVAEKISFSTRRVQDYWYSGARKLLNIPWVRAYALSLKEEL